MRLNTTEAWRRVERARHGVLGTRHEVRGVDLVPVVYTTGEDHRIFIPVDTIKAKTSTRLQRLENLSHDPRCTLLVEHYDDDWSQLWWVRVSGTGAEAHPAVLAEHLPRLATRYPQYADLRSIRSGIVVTPLTTVGWRAA